MKEVIFFFLGVVALLSQSALSTLPFFLSLSLFCLVSLSLSLSPSLPLAFPAPRSFHLHYNLSSPRVSPKKEVKNRN